MTYDEEVRFREQQRKQMRTWLQNPKVRQWRRALFLLYADGGPMPTKDIVWTLRGNHSSVFRTLKKLEIGCHVKSKRLTKKGKVALTWTLKPLGEREVVRCQRSEIIPDFYKRFSKG